MELVNEYAAVEVERDDVANGPRLRIKDLTSGRVIYLDPLELASLTWLEHSDLKSFVDPRFRDARANDNDAPLRR
ncbi:MAG TPA: hypothetical protein VNL15_04640 [Dehalococcoidia bacterium]|nr:hypothetical protein [Dehalococcoidia bacterium]